MTKGIFMICYLLVLGVALAALVGCGGGGSGPDFGFVVEQKCEVALAKPGGGEASCTPIDGGKQ